MEEELIAPCGMNCGICKFHYREKNQCPGCRADEELKPLGCKTCKIVNCDLIKNNQATYCFECKNIPCRRLKNLDKRYHTKYHMSMLENLEYIKQHGIKSFLEKEEKKWTCPHCSGIISCHGGMCLSCGYIQFISPPSTTNTKK